MSWPNSPEGQAFQRGVSTCHSPVACVDVSDLTDAELDLFALANPEDVFRVPPGWSDLTEDGVERIRTVVPGFMPPLPTIQEQVKAFLDTL